MAETSKVTWTDPRGVEWNLTTGEQGVILDMGQGGMSWPSIVHAFTRGGQVVSASTVQRGEHDLKVLVGHNLRGAELYALRRAWWEKANSPYDTGVLTIEAPDGQTRSRALRLADTPGTVHTYDPGKGLDHTAELWSLTGNNGWWDGPEQSVTFDTADFPIEGKDLFYGNTGAGWPLNIASATQAHDVFMENNGQGPMWLTWTLTGPMSTPRVGVPGGVIAFNGNIPAGDQVTITTAPTERAVVDASGASVYDVISGVFAPVPGGDRVPLTIAAEGMSPASRVQVTGREKFATAV